MNTNTAAGTGRAGTPGTGDPGATDALLRVAPLAGVAVVAVVGGALNHWVLESACAAQCQGLEASSDPRWVLVPAMEYSGAVLVFTLLGIGVLAATLRTLTRRCRVTAGQLATAGAVILLAAALGSSVTDLLGSGTVLPDWLQGLLPDALGREAAWLAGASGLGLLAILLQQARQWMDADERSPERRVRGALLGLTVVLPTATTSPLFNVSGFRTQILEQTVYASPDSAAGAGLGGALETAVAATSLLGLTAVVMLALLATTLPRPHGPAAHRLTALRALATDVRWLLVGGSAFLVFGVIQVHAVFEWGFQLAANAPDPDTIRGLVAAITGLAGVFYSAFLVVLFGPPLLLLRRWSRELAQEQADAEKAARAEADGHRRADAQDSAPERATPVEVQSWLETHGLEIRWPRAALTAFGMLAPLLAGGPASMLLDAVLG